MTKLFLDDVREPKDCASYMPYNAQLYLSDWKIVRNYAEFVAFIKEHGLPDVISFDHDLADEHYTPQEYWSDYFKSEEYQNSIEYVEKTGYDCARWLVDFCIEKRQNLPLFLVHSMNPVGRDNITAVLKTGSNILKLFK